MNLPVACKRCPAGTRHAAERAVRVPGSQDWWSGAVPWQACLCSCVARWWHTHSPAFMNASWAQCMNKLPHCPVNGMVGMPRLVEW